MYLQEGKSYGREKVRHTFQLHQPSYKKDDLRVYRKAQPPACFLPILNTEGAGVTPVPNTDCRRSSSSHPDSALDQVAAYTDDGVSLAQGARNLILNLSIGNAKKIGSPGADHH